MAPEFRDRYISGEEEMSVLCLVVSLSSHVVRPVSQRGVLGRTWDRGTHLSDLNYTTQRTTNFGRRSSFGCHVTNSNVSPGLLVELTVSSPRHCRLTSLFRCRGRVV